MDYTVIINYASVLLTIMFFLVFGVNIIVEVLKVFFTKVPTNYLAIIVSVAVTVLALFIWAAAAGFKVLWYYIVAAVILGIFVAYASMFGFDKFKEAWDKLKALKNLK